MPRVLDPASLSPGGGLAARRSVEASAFAHPTQGLDGLIAHIEDPSRAHMAEAVGVVDAGGYFASDEVEGALQEIASSAGATGQSGVVQGGTYTAVGLNVTMATPTYVMIGGTQRTLSGATNTLANNATNWLYANGSTGALTSSTGAAPTFTSPENVLFAKITTVGGVITASRDARWFVKNLDRKLPLTVRASGTEADRNSEAAFESIDAAILYLENFGSGVMRTFTLVLKGALTVASTITIPVDGVTVQGEDGCVLTSGASLAPMFDISGRSNLKFFDLSLVAAHAGSTAIGVTGSGSLTNVTVERCSFSGTGGQQWVSAVDVNAAGPQTRIFVRDGAATVTGYGVRLREPVMARVENFAITETGGAGTAGVYLGLAGGAINTTADCEVRGAIVAGFSTGVYMRGARMRLVSSDVSLADTCAVLDTDSSESLFADLVLSTDATNGLIGISLDAKGVLVRGCHISNGHPSATYAAQVPVGIDVATGTNVTIESCTIEDFYNSTTPGGFGIRFQGTHDQSLVQSTTVIETDTGITVLGASPQFRINGCVVRDVRYGIAVQGDAAVSNTTVDLAAARALVGMDLTGTGVRVDGCRITNTRASATYLIGDLPIGIRLNSTTRTTISGTSVSGFYNSTGNLGLGITASGASSFVSLDGCSFETCVRGVDFALVSNTAVSGCQVLDCEVGVYFGDQYSTLTGSNVVASTTRGTTGVAIFGQDAEVTGCTISNARAAYAGQTPIGVSLNAANAKVTGCRITGWRNAGGSLGGGVACLTGSSQVSIVGNTISTCWNGCYTDVAAAVTTLVFASNTLSGCDVYGLLATNADEVSVTSNTINLSAANSTGVSVANGTDIEVVGNKVNGGSGAIVGITLSGTDIAANRCRRFVISGNNIRAVKTAGISLDGYVQNGVVSNNHVDCNLAAGDPSAVACIRIVSSGTALAKYVEIVGNTLWRATNGIVASGVSYTALLTNLTISGNTIHHCAVSSAGTTECAGISTSWVRDSDISGNTIYQIGQLISDADVVSTPTAGPNVYPLGISMKSTYAVSVTNNEVSNLVAVGAGTSQGITLNVSGNAAVSPVVARSVNVSGNRLFRDDGSTGFNSGILVTFGQVLNPGDTSSLLGLLVSNNNVRNMNGPAITVSSGGGCTMEQVSITGNAISRTTNAGSGILVAAASSTDFADGILREVEISDNNIGDVAGRGVHVTAGSGTSLTGVTIQDNTVSSAANRGIHVEVSQAPAEFANLAILNNGVFGSTNAAIEVSAIDFAPTGMRVAGNTITGTNGGFSASTGIVISTTEVAVIRNDITNLDVIGNSVQSTDGAITIAVQGVLVDAHVCENAVALNSTNAPISVSMDTGSVVLAEAYSRNVFVDHNTIRDGYESFVLVGSGQKISNFSFSHNAVYSSGRHGFRFQVNDATVGSGEAVMNVNISSNQFDGVTEQAVRVLFGSTGNIDPVSNVSITGNAFSGCNTTGTGNETVSLLSSCLLANVSITDNTFSVCGLADALSGVVNLQMGGPGIGGFAAKNVRVTQNSFRECSGPAVYSTDNPAAGAWSVIGLEVDGNRVNNNTYTPFYVDLTASAIVSNLSVSRNEVYGVAGATNNTGIEIYGPTSGAVGGVKVCSNTLRNTLSGVAGCIYLSFPDDVRNMSIDGNHTTDDTASGAAIYITLDGRWYNGSISNNMLDNPDGAGVVVDFTGVGAVSGATGLSILGNQVRESSSGGIYVTGSSGAGSDPVFSGITIANNGVDTLGGDGIKVEALLGTTSLDNIVIAGNNITDTSTGIAVTTSGSVGAENISVVGNTVRTCTANGIDVGFASAIPVNVTVSDNVVYDTSQNGIFVSGTLGVTHLSITGNQVRNWSQSAGATDYGGIAVTVLNGDMESLLVSCNVVSVNTEDDAIGYLFTHDGGAVQNFVFSDNTAFLNNQTNTTSLLFTAGATSNQVGMTFTGNTFRGAATGVTGTAVNFAPSYSVCANNVERTSGGGGNWGTGGAGTFTDLFTNSIVSPNQD